MHFCQTLTPKPSFTYSSYGLYLLSPQNQIPMTPDELELKFNPFFDNFLLLLSLTKKSVFYA